MRTDVFGGCECFLKEVIEHEPEGFVFPGGCNGLFKLSHDLGFTEHHGVNAAAHAENVAGGIALRVAVKVRLKLRKRYHFGFGNKVRERLSGLFCVFCSAVDFGAVAGRKNHRFGQSALTAAGEPVAQRMKAGPDFIGAERNAFTHRKRCCGVIQAKTKQLHECSSAFCLRRLGFRQAKLLSFFPWSRDYTSGNIWKNLRNALRMLSFRMPYAKAESRRLSDPVQESGGKNVFCGPCKTV